MMRFREKAALWICPDLAGGSTEVRRITEKARESALRRLEAERGPSYREVVGAPSAETMRRVEMQEAWARFIDLKERYGPSHGLTQWSRAQIHRLQTEGS